MRPDHRTKTQQPIASPAHVSQMPIRAANQKRHIPSALIALICDHRSESTTVHRFTTFIQRYQICAISRGAQQQIALSTGTAPLLVLNLNDRGRAKAQAPTCGGKSGKIICGKRRFGATFLAAHCNHRNPQRVLGRSDCHPARFRRRRPHLFKLIKLTHFRAEEVDDDIARIDQNPVARALAFGPAENTAVRFQDIG